MVRRKFDIPMEQPEMQSDVAASVKDTVLGWDTFPWKQALRHGQEWLAVPAAGEPSILQAAMSELLQEPCRSSTKWGEIVTPDELACGTAKFLLRWGETDPQMVQSIMQEAVAVSRSENFALGRTWMAVVTAGARDPRMASVLGVSMHDIRPTEPKSSFGLEWTDFRQHAATLPIPGPEATEDARVFMDELSSMVIYHSIDTRSSTRQLPNSRDVLLGHPILRGASEVIARMARIHPDATWAGVCKMREAWQHNGLGCGAILSVLTDVFQNKDILAILNQARDRAAISQ